MEIIFTAFFEIIAAAVAPAMAAAISLMITAMGVILAPLSMLAELAIQAIFDVGKAPQQGTDPKEVDQKEIKPTPESQVPQPKPITKPDTESPAQKPDAFPPHVKPVSSTERKTHWHWTRQVAKVSASVLAITIVILVILQWAFLPSVVRWTLARAEKKSGVSIQFESVTGNLFTGSFYLTDVAIKRVDHALSDFDLHAPKLNLNLDMSRAVQRKLRFDAIEVNGLRGSYIRKGKKAPNAPKKQFEVAELQFRDAIVDIQDTTHPNLPPATLQITSGSVGPLRGHQAISDVLLHSQVEGTINDQVVTAVSDFDAGSGTATWTLRKASVKALTTIVGPLSWVDQGAISARLSCQWKSADDALPVHCEFQFHDVAAHVPEDAAIQTKLVATPVLNWVNNHARNFDTAFDVRVPRSAIEGRIWLADSALMIEIGEGLKGELISAAASLGDATTDLKDSLKQKAIDAAKDAAKKAGESFLNRFKKDN